MRHGRRSGAARLAAVVLACAAAGLGAPTPARAQQGGQADLTPLNLSGGVLVRLEMDLSAPIVPMVLNLPIGGEWRAVELWPHSVRAEGFQLFEQGPDGRLVEVKPAAERTVRGRLLDAEGSAVAGGIEEDGLYLRVIMPDDRQYWVQPSGDRLPGMPAGTHVVYTADDRIAGDHRCGTDDVLHQRPQDGHDHGGDEGERGATVYTAQLATDADFEFFARYGSSARVQSRIATVVNTMNLQYERELDITHVITSSIVRTSEPDPYTSSNSNTLLDQFRAHWNANHNGITRDVAQLFTGKEVDGSVIGLAWVGVICDWDDFAYGMVQSDFDGLFMSATDLSAHEIGHNWNAGHCTCSSPAFTMNPWITAINRHQSGSISSIVAHRNSRSCLTTGGGGSVAPNDACASAVLIGPGTFGFSNLQASNDGPLDCAMGDNVWYTYTAPCDGTVTVTTCGSTFDTVVAAYTGSCSSLTLVECSDDHANCGGSPPRQSFISFAVTRNTTYRIGVGGFAGINGSGLLNLTQSACPTPANDNCGNAITIEQGQTYNFSNIGATLDGPIENLDCNFFSDAQISSDIWYRYIAPCAGTVRVSTCGSGFDTELAIYNSCPSTANSSVACNDDNGPACAGTRSSVDFTAASGADYYIRVGGYGGAQGSGVLAVQSLACPPPANNLCQNALPVGNGTTAFSTLYATTDGPAETLCNFFGDTQVQRDIWYVYTATCSGDATVDMCPSAYDTKVAIYQGASCPTADNGALACNDDACGTNGWRSRVTFPVLNGGQYLVRIGGYGGGTGNGSMTITCTPAPPANNACASAINVSGGGTFTGTLVAATNDGANGCGSSATNPDVWYVYTAPCDGTLRVTSCGTHDLNAQDTGMDSVISLHSACPGTSANQLACNDDNNGCPGQDAGIIRDSVVTTPVTGGQVVYIRFSKFGSHPVIGEFRLNVALQQPNDACANAILVGNGTTTFCTRGATTDGPPDLLCDWLGDSQVQRDIWFRYTATCTGPVVVDLCASALDTKVAVYGATCPASADTALACNDDTCGLNGWRSHLTFNGVSGAQYLVRIGGFYGLTGSGTMTISCGGADCNGNGTPDSGEIAGNPALDCFNAAATPIGGFHQRGSPNGVLDACECQANWNRDGAVGTSDISGFLSSWFNDISTGQVKADINCSGSVGTNDISGFLSIWFAAVAGNPPYNGCP
ncbi:MAG TPA: M12 family metallo-peptidase [Phycisphaerales bacterium]|nr:M12 family metallo-peptidase [Phycisphaerales bacterium]